MSMSIQQFELTEGLELNRVELGYNAMKGD
jgi:hypothetical protein